MRLRPTYLLRPLLPADPPPPPAADDGVKLDVGVIFSGVRPLPSTDPDCVQSSNWHHIVSRNDWIVKYLVRETGSRAGHKRRSNWTDGSVRKPWPTGALGSRATAVVVAATTRIVTNEIVLKRVPIFQFIQS